MKITSLTTYIVPFLFLLASAAYFVDIFFGIVTYPDEVKGYLMAAIESIAIASLFFYAFRKLAKTISKYKALKYLIILVPHTVKLIVAPYLHLDVVAIFAGSALYCGYATLAGRYTATLTEDRIEYENLLGQAGSIYLKDLVKLEQNRNFLTIFKEFKFIDLAKKTTIAFTDEHLDEYEITIYTKTLKSDEVFAAIIQNANKCGNLKVRQYVI